jgi:hypothetical protein
MQKIASQMIRWLVADSYVACRGSVSNESIRVRSCLSAVHRFNL